MNPHFSIVIPAHNSRVTLELLLRCLETQTLPPGQFECLIVDDGSTDGTARLFAQQQPQYDLRLFTHPTNLGRGVARNTALRHARGEIVVFLDSDMLPEPGWLAEYQRAFEASDLDVISGGRYCLDVGSQWQRLADQLACMAGVAVEALLRDDIAAQFCNLRGYATLGQYPGFFEAFERQMREVCARWPTSLICAYSLVTSNVAVRRGVLDRAGGFDPMIRHVEDTELGLRLWEIGARFGFADRAAAYHLYDNRQPRILDIYEYLSFFYRHPYRLVFLVYFWTVYQASGVKAPLPMLESLTALAEAGRELDSVDVGGLFTRLHKRPFPADCQYDKATIVAYCTQRNPEIAPAQIAAYLDLALERGLYVQRSGNQVLFDIFHTINWLRNHTPLQQHDLRSFLYARNHKTPLLRTGRRDELVALRYQGTYTVTIAAELVQAGRREGTINIPLPIEHPCQRDVRITNCVPDSLLNYVDRSRGMVVGLPLPLARDDTITIGYDFACVVQEHAAAEAHAERESSVSLAGYLQPTYPAEQVERAKLVLKRIFPAPVDDSFAVARSIYGWVLDHILYLQTSFPDWMVLQLGAGPCLHQARLFVNLCRLMRIAARERCGAPFLGASQPGGEQVLTMNDWGFSPFAHTWAEFYAPTHGWVPVEFIGRSFGKRILTALNVVDRQLRAEVIEDTSRFDAYYFGAIDPYRIYASDYCNKAPTYPLFAKPGGQKSPLDILNHTYHRITIQTAERHRG